MNSSHSPDQALLSQAGAYSEAVKAFSERSQDDYLLCGIHYRDFALLLHPSPFSTLPSDPTPITAEQTTTAGYVTVIDLQKVTYLMGNNPRSRADASFQPPKNFWTGHKSVPTDHSSFSLMATLRANGSRL
jgi:hypothetical protein